jgi:outer membrane protein OmpA-like peptidoglycan-associated protein
MDTIELATASLSLYEQLEKDGKIVTNDIHFDFNKASIRESSMGIIQGIADMLGEHPEIKLSIEGHTDDLGSSNYNRELSTHRAEAVKAMLVKLSISPQRLTSKGDGESKPLMSNINEASRAKNRRLEFVRQ